MLVVLGISGGIAAYKACEIVRGLDRGSVEVQVVMTRNAARFVSPLTLRTLSRRPVLSETFEAHDDETVRHVEIAREAAALVVAPATANTVAKFAHGIADDLLSTLHLAVRSPVLVAPAMNTRMLQHPATLENLHRLRDRGVTIIEPTQGWLAEGEIGWGRMSEPAAIVAATLAAASRSTELAGRTIVVTAGPTRESIDPVRFLSNRSSGKMGFALAAAAARRGARVKLISGPVDEPAPFGVEIERVTTSAEMRIAVLAARRGAEAVFMAAAVADWIPRAAPSKIKRNGRPIAFQLDEGPDILAELGRARDERLLIGFAAETEDVTGNARGKLERKNLDFIVANDVSRPHVGIDADENEVTIISRDGRAVSVPRATKSVVAEAILDAVFAVAEAK